MTCVVDQFGPTDFSLIGESADYSIQLVSAKLSDDEERVPGWLGRVLPGLGMALGTSLLGYAAMTLVPLPSIRQIAVFALTGLATAFVTVVLLGPTATSVLRGGKVSAVFGGFGFAGSPEPDAFVPFIAPDAVTKDDLVVDLRSLEEAPVSSFPGARRLMVDDVGNLASEHPAGRIVLACRSGQRALMAADRLRERGLSNLALVALG
ncbi:MAG: hypothetical protein EBY18_00695 [Alphaproteobacteria bacterium]|nr:hypothetical protein [Alphaproteobacteria bacterium]